MSVFRETKEARRAVAIFGLLKWPLFGALIAGGALVVAREFGPQVVRELGGNAGEGFAEGVVRVQTAIAKARGEYG
jgi:hypothetical protein